MRSTVGEGRSLRGPEPQRPMRPQGRGRILFPTTMRINSAWALRQLLEVKRKYRPVGGPRPLRATEARLGASVQRPSNGDALRAADAALAPAFRSNSAGARSSTKSILATEEHGRVRICRREPTIAGIDWQLDIEGGARGGSALRALAAILPWHAKCGSFPNGPPASGRGQTPREKIA